jgi:alanyl-tRNA synthetase
MRHHTATHLLLSALRKVLGEHVSQAGSLVDEKHTRFDFTHHEPLTDEQIEAVEDIVNRWTLADIEVKPQEMPLDEAIARGATALFGEKYGETVRLIEIDDASMELCGGTHAPRTGTIGEFRITSQESVAAGIRRVEAVAGMVAMHRDRDRERVLSGLAQKFGVPPEEVGARVSSLEDRIKQLQDEVKAARQMRATADVGTLVADAVEIGPAKLIAKVVPDVDREMLAALADEIAGRMSDAVVLLGSVSGGKIALVCQAADRVVATGAHAGNLLKAVAAVVGGGGGGKPQFAQAGGKDPDKLEEAVASAAGVLEEQLKS